MSYHALIHIAAVPTETQQRCMRCCAVLIDAKGAMRLDDLEGVPYAPGAFVGVIPGGSFVQEHDATGPDESACDVLQR